MKSASGKIQALVEKRAVELAPSFPRFYRQIFIVQKGSATLSDFKPLHLEQVHYHDQVPHGDHQISLAVHPGGWVARLKDVSARPRSLFVSPSKPLRPVSKNTLSYFLHDCISSAGAILMWGTLLFPEHTVF